MNDVAVQEFAHLAARHEVPHATDFPFELDAVFVAHLLPHHLAQHLDLEGIGLAEIEQEVGVQFAHLGAAKRQSPAAGFIDQRQLDWPSGFLNVEPPVLALVGCEASRFSVISRMRERISSGSPANP